MVGQEKRPHEQHLQAIGGTRKQTSNNLWCGIQTVSLRMNSRAADNSTYKKLAVQLLNEALCFVASSVLADSFRLRNRQLLVAANRCRLFSSDRKLKDER